MLIAVTLKRRNELEQVADGVAVVGVLREEVENVGLDALILGLLSRQLLRRSVLLVELLNHLVELLGGFGVAVPDGVDGDGESDAIGHLGSTHGINPFSVCGVRLPLITCLL